MAVREEGLAGNDGAARLGAEQVVEVRWLVMDGGKEKKEGEAASQGRRQPRRRDKVGLQGSEPCDRPNAWPVDRAQMFPQRKAANSASRKVKMQLKKERNVKIGRPHTRMLSFFFRKSHACFQQAMIIAA